MKISNNTIGNRTRDLPVCSTVPQSTAPPPALLEHPEFTISFHFLSCGAYSVDCRVVTSWKQTLYFSNLHKKRKRSSYRNNVQTVLDHIHCLFYRNALGENIKGSVLW